MGVSISSGLGEIFSFGGKLIDRLIPDPAQKLAAQTELAKMAMDNSLAVMANETALIRTQTDTNLEQAKSQSLFIAGPLPALMWVGVLGVFYQWVLLPAGVFTYTLYFGKPIPIPPPAVDPNLFLTLGGLMGLQIGARSWEKAKGVAS